METLLLLKVSIQPCFLAVLGYYIGDLSYSPDYFVAISTAFCTMRFCSFIMR